MQSFLTLQQVVGKVTAGV